MWEIALDLNFLEEQWKLDNSDSLINIQKNQVFTNPTELVIASPVTPQSTDSPNAEGFESVNQDVSNRGSQVSTEIVGRGSPADYEARSSDTSHSKVRSLLLLIFIFISTLVLLASLVLSAYSLYLIAQTSERMDDLSNSQLHSKYLEEIKEWKAIIQRLLPHSAALQAK